jgi:precorrin-8X/cobalt-precorrin-8 methylmutase
MNEQLRRIAPGEIEAESFRIIEEELGGHGFDPRTFAVVRRVIHATGDFSFAETMRFHPEAIAAGIEAIRAGRNVLADVNMAAAGIGRGLLARWGGEVFCGVARPEVAGEAKREGLTRSEVAVARLLDESVGLVAIGNAPTALLEVMAIGGREPRRRPALVIGVPVGFVNAAESKEILARQEYPFITCLGRKGGSPVAAAIVNALLRLAAEE